MVFSALPKKELFRLSFFWLVALAVSFLSVSETQAKIVIEKHADLGVIKGVVRDEQGSPISDAMVAIFRVGTSKLLKQVRSATDGSFLARVMPGTYTVLAVAEGFNPATVSEVSVNRSAEIIYGFKLERAGSGNTLPEKRADRNSQKWRILATASRRSIYQNREGKAPVDETQTNVEESIGVSA